MGAKTLACVSALTFLIFVGILIWAILDRRQDSTITELSPGSIGSLENKAYLTRIPNTGDVFWWFFPTTKEFPTAQPLVLWIDGYIGLPPSFLANFGMFGPYDHNLKERPSSWINSYNLLFIDLLGTGFSKASDTDRLPRSAEEASERIVDAVRSFYSLYEEYKDAPLFIFGQGYGAQIGAHLSVQMLEDDVDFAHNLRGIVINNGIIAPAIALTKLGFYLEELGYIDGKGREAVENLSDDTTRLVEAERFDEAFDNFISLENFINENAGAVSVNLGHIIYKQSPEISRDYFGIAQYYRDMFKNIDTNVFMEDVANKIGLTGVEYNAQSEAALQSLKQSFMKSATATLEHILQQTDLFVHVINGNLDAVSNTPGQLEWVNSLDWPEKDVFSSSPRQTLVVNRQVEGYFRRSAKFSFYWMNVAGLSVPLDSPVAMRRIVELIMENEVYESDDDEN